MRISYLHTAYENQILKQNWISVVNELSSGHIEGMGLKSISFDFHIIERTLEYWNNISSIIWWSFRLKFDLFDANCSFSVVKYFCELICILQLVTLAKKLDEL